MLFWKPVWALLRLRFQAARNTFALSPTPMLWTLLMAGVLAVAALGRGNRLAAQWALLPIDAAQTALQQTWLLMQGLWLLALLLPGVVSLLGDAPPPAVLRRFALRPLQILASEVLAGLLDVPALLSLLLTLPLAAHLFSQGQWAQAIVVVIAFGLLALQTGLLARLLAHVGSWGARRLRRWADVPVFAMFLLFGLCVGMPPALASLTSAPTPQTRLLTVTMPALSPAILIPVLPSSMAARVAACTRNGNVGGTAGALCQLLLCVGVTGSGALLMLRGAARPLVASKSRSTEASEQRQSANRHHFIRESPQWLCVVVTEWRLLLRVPQNYLRLRKPASILLLCVFAFLSPDMSRNPVYNLKEFLGVGALLYNVLWQMQLLCNRFGSEAGTGTLLFGFSVPRRTLLLGKNVALLLLLLLLNGPAIAGLCIVAGFPQNIALFWLWLPLILLVLTALGNLLSVLNPFAIKPTGRRGGTEPPEALAAGYVFVGCLAAILLVPVGWLLSPEHAIKPVGVMGAMTYAGGLYALSLVGTSALLTKREYGMIGGLDGFAGVKTR